MAVSRVLDHFSRWVIPYHFNKFFDMTVSDWTKLGIRVASPDICSPMKFERHQLYGFSNMEVQNIGFFAIFNVPQTVSAPITRLFFIALKNRLHYLKAQRMSFRVIYYMASFAELANWPHLFIS